MSSQDDPEARIRDLERSVGEQPTELTQSSYEIGAGPTGYAAPPAYSAPVPPPYSAPQPPYGMPYPPPPSRGSGRGWVVYALAAAVLVAVIGGAYSLVANVFSNVNTMMETFHSSPTASGGGGGPFDVPPSRSGVDRPPAPTVAPTIPVGPPGGDLSVAGFGSNKTMACNDSIVNISGVKNTVRITGQCRSVTVSGVENTVTVDAAATISASGFDNRVTFLSGTPEIDNMGDNIVEPG